jgi:hypothetical protein
LIRWPTAATPQASKGWRAAFSARHAAYAEIITSAANPRHYTIERLRTDDGQDMLRGLAQVEAARESSFFSNLIKSPQPKVFNQIDLSDDPVLPPPMQIYRSALAVPMFSEGAVGRWCSLAREADQFGVAGWKS